MARVMRSRDQIALIAGLRWRLFWNSLRTRRDRGDLVIRALLAVVLFGAVGGLGLLFGFAAWLAVHMRQGLILQVDLAGTMAVWQVVPILVLGFGARGDFLLLLRFPVAYRSFVFLSLASGLTDPSALAGMYFCGAMLVGMAIARLGALVWAIPAMAIFAAVNLLLSRVLFAWLERWLAERRTREILGVLFLASALGAQFAGQIGLRWKASAPGLMNAIAPIIRLTPSGLCARTIEAGARRYMPGVLWNMFGLAGYGLLLTGLLSIRLRAQYRGENVSEAPALRPVGDRRDAAHTSWHVAGLPPAVGALLETNFRYLRRNTTQFMSLCLPIALTLLFGIRSLGRSSPLHGPALVAIASSYCFLSIIGHLYNSLGYDGAGIALMLGAPIRFENVMLAKNLLHTLVLTAQLAIVVPLACWLGGTPPASLIALVGVSVLFSLVLNMIAGNLISLRFPRKLAFGTLRRQSSAGAGILLIFALQLLVGGLAGGMYLLGEHLDRPWLPVWAVAALMLAALPIYRQNLQRCSSLAIERREDLLEQLCR